MNTVAAWLDLNLITLAFVLPCIFLTSFISGVFGAAGGTILLGLLLIRLDVGAAMMIFSASQITSCIWRFVLWRKHVYWRVLGGFVPGALAAIAAILLISYVPSKPVVYLGLGVIPLIIMAVPKNVLPDITSRNVQIGSGALLTSLYLLVGTAGVTADALLQKAALDRKAAVATKAFIQLFSHVLRLSYFGSVLSIADEQIGIGTLVVVAMTSLAATTVGGVVLGKMSDTRFQRWSQVVISAVTASFLARGVWLIAVR